MFLSTQELRIENLSAGSLFDGRGESTPIKKHDIPLHREDLTPSTACRRSQSYRGLTRTLVLLHRILVTGKDVACVLLDVPEGIECGGDAARCIEPSCPRASVPVRVKC